MEERPIINLVYEHLQQHQMFAVHRGPITVIATPVPVQGCAVYAYANAYSFRGKQPGMNVLLLFEPVVVLPGQYDKRIWDHFDYVVTLYDALIERAPDKFRKIPVFRSDWLLEAPITENLEERNRLYPVENRKNAVCMIGGNKRSQIPGELYSKRVEAALWFHLYSDIPFDVYGNSIFPLPNYRGALGTKEKFSTLAQYKFCLCYENTNHPQLARGYVEKIFDCLETRTIPIYLGCPDIEKYVPQDCFIDLRKFSSYRDLVAFLHAMDQNLTERYIRAIDSWVTEGGLRPYSMHAVYARLAELYAASVGRDISAYGSPVASWEPGMSPSLKDLPLVSSPGTPQWSYNELASAASPLIDYTGPRGDPFPGADAALKNAQRLQKEKKYQEAVRHLEAAFKDGFFNVNLLYLYARMLAAVSRHDESMTQLLRVIALDAGHSHALNDIGALFSLKKDFKQAVQYLHSAIMADGQNYGALENLLSLFATLGFKKENVQFITQSLLTQFPDDARLKAIMQKFDHPTQHREEKPSSDTFNATPDSPLHRSYTLKKFKSPTGSLSAEFLSDLKRIFHADVFVETGTFMGGTTLEASRIFKSVHTVELSEELYRQSQARFAGRDNIHGYQGDSGKIFPELLKKIDGKIVFWLDGHYSEGVTAKADLNSPILCELVAIKNAGITDSVILIDDLRMFPNSWTRLPERASLRDYPPIPQLLPAIEAINPSYTVMVLGDILIAYQSSELLTVSPVVAACTISRFFENDDTDVQQVMDAEMIISRASGEELARIQELYGLLSPETAGLGEHYRLWFALALLEQGRSREACDLLQNTLSNGFTHWRVRWYLAQAAYRSGDAALANRELQEVLCIAPDYTNARTLLKDIQIQKRSYRGTGDILSRLLAGDLWREGEPLRLHLGCGENHFDGYINIDFPPSEHSVQTTVAADLFADVTLIDFPDQTVDEIRLHHVFEHFSRSKALALLVRWHAWLKLGGKLHIETPDVIGSARTLLADMPYRTKQGVLRHAFGSHEAPWAYHLDGWYKEKFEHVLSRFGFEVQCLNQQWKADPWLSNVHAISVKQRSLSRSELLSAADEILLDSMVADVPAERAMHKVWCDLVRSELERKPVKEIVPNAGTPRRLPDLSGFAVKPDSPDLDQTGFDVIDSTKNGEYKVLNALIRPGDLVFDVGANKGNWSKQIHSIKPGLRIYAFEPVPPTFSVLQQTLRGTDVAAFNIALSDKDEQKTFYHYTNNSQIEELSSFYRRPEVEKGLNIAVRPIQVQSRTLDSFCSEHAIERIDFLKIDAEGGELDVLAGAAALLARKRINVIQFEYGGTFQDARVTLRQAYDLLSRSGYQIYRIIPDGLVSIREWRESLENYRYSNYLAVVREAAAMEPPQPNAQKIQAPTDPQHIFNVLSAAVRVDNTDPKALNKLIDFFQDMKKNSHALDTSTLLKDICSNGIYGIGAKTLPQDAKRALIIYVSEPIPWFIAGRLDEFPPVNFHSMWWETAEMVRLLNAQGFIVDFIGVGSPVLQNPSFDWNKYDVIIDGGENNLCNVPPTAKAIKICYTTGQHWLKANLAEMNRIRMFYERHGILMPQDRMQGSNFSDERADYLTFFGNQSQLDGFHPRSKKIRLNISCTHIPQPRDKNIELARKNFIWLGGQAMIHKGLDLVIDAFRTMPDMTLHIGALMHTESKFQAWLKPVLEQHKNIVFHGALNVASRQFAELAWNSIGAVYVSAAEGGPGSVAQLLHFGIIPIVTRSSNVRAENLGYIIDEKNDRKIIDGIIEKVRTIADSPEEELRKRSSAVRHFAGTWHTREAYSKSFEDLLREVMKPDMRKMIGIVFSKDRAMQLDCTLRSFFLHCSDPELAQVTVLYKSSSAKHESQYQALTQAYPSVRFAAETDFKNDVLGLLDGNDQVLFLVDDNIFVRAFSLQDIRNGLDQNAAALGFSLRLGLNTTFCYMLGKSQILPLFDRLDKAILKYAWTTAELDFGYPLELSSSTYRVIDLKPLFERIDFKNPNTLEQQMEANKSVFSASKNHLLCFDQSVTFCNPVNMVQTMWMNKAGKDNEYSADKLSELFAQGRRIDASRFAGFVPNSCHQEAPFEFMGAQASGTANGGAAAPRMPFVTIGIANYNGIQHIQGCLESIRRNTPEPHEIIVVDNGSVDGSREYLRKQTDIILVENSENKGAPGARNQFLTIARGDYIVFLDNDTFVTQDWIKKLIAHMEADPAIGIIGACSNYASGLQGIAGVTYGTISELEEYAKKRSREHRGELLPSPRLISFCVFVRKAAVEKIGAMETGFSKFCYEDDDYAMRIHIAGFKSLVANDVFIHHTGGPQGRGDAQYNKWLRDAWEGFKRKWGLPVELPFGSSYVLDQIVQQPFDPKRHYLPLPPRSSVEPLIYRPDQEQIGGAQSSPVEAQREKPEKHPMTRGLTSIIIATSDELRTVKPCIESIKKFTPELYELIVVTGSGAHDAYAHKLETLAGKKTTLKLLKQNTDRSYAKCLNDGVRASSGEYLLVLDPQVIVSDGWLTNLLAQLLSAPDTGIIGPLSNNAAGPQKVESGDVASNARLATFAKHIQERYPHRRVNTTTLGGFCLLLRYELFEKIGAFDENLEVNNAVSRDYGVRSNLAGFRNLIAGDVFVQSNDTGNDHRAEKAVIDKWDKIDPLSLLGGKYRAMKAIEKAGELFDKDQPEPAIAALMDGIKQAAGEKVLYVYLAETLLESKRYQDALDTLGSLPEESKNDARALELLGYCKEGLGLFDNAREHVDRSLELNPRSAPALNLKGLLAYKQNDKPGAESFFAKAVEADPGYGEPYTNLGVLRWAADQKDDAFKLLERGFILSPATIDIITAYHSAVNATESFARSEPLFYDAKALHPKNRRIAFLLIDLLIKQEKYELAMQEIEQSLLLFGIDDGILCAALEVRGKIGPLDKKPASKKEKSLSLCMIVKNEEQYLAKCLMSVKPIANEIIIVDTGSTDRSKDIATAFGAKVFDIAWTNDFSEARNLSLSRASGDWIFALDADEVISARDYPFFFKVLKNADPRTSAYSFNTRNYTNVIGLEGWSRNDDLYFQDNAGSGWIPSRKARLFPKDKDIRFENPVHELVEPSLLKKGLKIIPSDVPIHHYGRLNLEKLHAKHEKYYALGKKKLKEKGNDVRALMELAIQAAELQKHDESIELLNAVIALNPQEALAYYNMGGSLLFLKRYTESLAITKKAVELAPARKEGVTNYAMSELLVGDVNQAAAVLRDLVAKGSDYPIALALLAATDFIKGDSASGRRYFDKLQAMNFNVLPFVHDTATRLIECDRTEQAKRLIDGARACGFTNHELATLRASCDK